MSLRPWLPTLGVVALALGASWLLLRSRGSVRPPTLTGKVVDPDGNPVEAGVWRLPMDWEVMEPLPTDEHGRFSFPLPAQEIRLLASHRDWAESEPQSIDGNPGSSIDGIVLRLRRPARVTGRMVDEAGNPVPHQLVLCCSGSLVANDTEPTADTDERGEFVLDGCDPGPARLSTLVDQWIELEEGQEHHVVLTIPAEKVPPERREDQR